MAEPWESDPIVTPAAPTAEPWESDPIVQQAPVPQTTGRGIARNAAAALAEDVPAGLINFAADPSGSLMRLPIVAAGTAYDAAAPYLGLPRMSPELRGELYGQPVPMQPGATYYVPRDLSPEALEYVKKQTPDNQPDVPVGTRVMNWIDSAVLPPDRSATTLPATPDEAMVRRGVGAAGTMAAVGPGGIVAPVVAGASAVAAPEIAKQVPDWARPGVELAVNTLPQMATGALASRAGPTVDAADAATMRLAREKYQIPVNAPTITPGSQYRTPASAQAEIDGLQRNIVTQMGENPKTGDYATQDRITTGPGGVMDRTATRVGQGFDDVASRTNITPDETNNIITKLANIDGHLDLTAGITSADKVAIRRNIDLVQNAAVNGNGTISGADYQALTKYNADIDRLASNSDPNLAAFGIQIKHVLDDGFQASASEADKAALTNLRYQWRLMKTVQPLAEKAQGANIDPGEFSNRVVAASRKLDGSTGGIAYTGGGTIGELGRIGNLISRAPAPAQSSLMADIVHPSVGGVLLAERYPALAAGGTRRAGRWKAARRSICQKRPQRRGCPHQRALPPDTIGRRAAGRRRRRHGQSAYAASTLAPIKANVSLVALVDGDARQPDENEYPDAEQRVVYMVRRPRFVLEYENQQSQSRGDRQEQGGEQVALRPRDDEHDGEGHADENADQNVHFDNSVCVE